MTKTTRTKGVSLAKGPVGLLGMLALIHGITALIFGGHSFTHALGGTVNGKTWLGLEVNAWSSLLFIGAGALLLFGAPLHWGAKATSLIVGLALGATCLIALVDGHDVLGIFAANGLTRLVWGAATALLLILARTPPPTPNAPALNDAQSARRGTSSACRLASASRGSTATARPQVTAREAAERAAAWSPPRREPRPRAATRPAVSATGGSRPSDARSGETPVRATYASDLRHPGADRHHRHPTSLRPPRAVPKDRRTPEGKAKQRGTA